MPRCKRCEGKIMKIEGRYRCACGKTDEEVDPCPLRSEFDSGGDCFCNDNFGSVVDYVGCDLTYQKCPIYVGYIIKKDLYRERSYLVSYLAKMFPSSLEPAEDCKDDPEFNWMVYIDLPEGQVSWHVAESDIEIFGAIEKNAGRKWDGHDTIEKYKRMSKRYIVTKNEDKPCLECLYKRMCNDPCGAWEELQEEKDNHKKDVYELKGEIDHLTEEMFMYQGLLREAEENEDWKLYK